MADKHIDAFEISEIVKARAASGQLERDELTALADELLKFPWQPEHFIVEIGTYKGRTPVMMAKVLDTIGQHPAIISIDAFERVIPTRTNIRGTYALAIASILEAGLGSQCILISGASNDVANFIPDRIAALIVDGWHSYEQTMADLDNYMPKVVPGGFALIDDYCDFYPDVIRAIDEFLVRCESTITVERKLSKGLIVRKR